MEDDGWSAQKCFFFGRGPALERSMVAWQKHNGPPDVSIHEGVWEIGIDDVREGVVDDDDFYIYCCGQSHDDDGGGERRRRRKEYRVLCVGV